MVELVCVYVYPRVWNKETDKNLHGWSSGSWRVPKGDGAETDRSYLDQVLLMYESANERPKRRLEGVNASRLKFFSNRKYGLRSQVYTQP